MVGGFARQFDQISAEYGWSDEEILDLPLARLRQVSATIEFRRDVEDRMERVYLEWHTKTLAQFIAATVPMDKKGQKNPLVEAATALTLFPETIQKAKEPKVGSYEQLARLFKEGGGPH